MNRIMAFGLAAALGIAGGATVAAPGAAAQPAPRPGAMGDHGPGPGGPGGPGGGPGGFGHDGMHGEGMRGPGGWMRRMRQFALIYPAADRNLSGADVQKIAEAFLLLNGNHSWKVTEVTEQPDQVRFALATPDGTAIAHFAMDRHTGRPERID